MKTMGSYSRLLCMLAVIAAAACTGAGRQEASRLARLLDNPDTRDAAACRLLELHRYLGGKPPYKEERCRQIRGAVNHVIVAPQMFVVFRHWPYDDEEIGPGKARGPFTLFDGDGNIVPVFESANFFDEDTKVIAYAGDTRLAIAQIILYASERRDADGRYDHNWTTQVLHIVPIDSRQHSVLSVILGPATYGLDDDCKGYYWGWRTRDMDADGIPEIEIGPWLDEKTDGNIKPRAVYRWSNNLARYEGPSGSIEDGFLRIDDVSDDFHKKSEQFASERLRLAIPGDPSAVRRGKCDTVTESVVIGDDVKRRMR